MNQLAILLVEDDPDDIELMQEAFKNVDIAYSMDIISQGDRVMPHLELCKKFPNVIVLDLNLPKLHGREILTLLKSSERFRDIPVAILTTASSEVEKENCLNCGADLFLTKPSTVDGFNKTIEAIVSISQTKSN